MQPDAQTAKVGLTFILGLAMTLVTLSALVTLVWCLDTGFQPDHPAAGDLGLALLNALPLTLVALLLLALTQRPLLSAWFAIVCALLLYHVNTLKTLHLATPLLPSDFQLAGQIATGNGLLLKYLPSDHLQYLLYAGIALATLAALVLPPRLAMRKRTRGALAATVLLASASLLAGMTPWNALYSKEKYDFQPWAPTHSAERTGLFASLLMQYWATLGAMPTPDRDEARDLVYRIEQHAGIRLDTPAAAPAADLPDIVVMQSESLFDPSRLNGIAPEQNLRELRRLSAHAWHGNLWVPTYGGGTIRTEFETLTGIALRYFPQQQYPYYGMVTPRMPALPGILAGHGYRTIAVHPNSADFWNRASAFASMGFQRFDDDSTFADAPRVGYFTSDEALVDHVLAQLGDDDASPAFIFAISMENHGPYGDTGLGEEAGTDPIEVPAKLDAAQAGSLRDYLFHVHNADRALGRLADALMKRKRRTLLLFYGDHLPALANVYDSLGFRDGAGHGQQPVPWLLLDSAATESRTEDTASYFLPAHLLRMAGIDDPYFRALEVVQQETTFDANHAPAGDPQLGELMGLRRLGEWPSATGASPGPPVETVHTP